MILIKYVDGQTVNNPSDWNILSSVPIRFLEYQNGNRSIRLIGYDSYVKFAIK